MPVAPFLGIAPWKADAGKQGWHLRCCEMLWRSVQETSCHTFRELNLLKTPTLMKASLRLHIVACSLQAQEYKGIDKVVHQKLAAPRPVAWLIFSHKTLLASHFKDPVRGATVSTFGTAGGAFFGNCPLEGWWRQARMAFGMLWDAMKECSGKKLSHFPRTESAQNTYTHEGISSTTHSGLQPASTRVQSQG